MAGRVRAAAALAAGVAAVLAALAVGFTVARQSARAPGLEPAEAARLQDLGYAEWAQLAPGETGGGVVRRDAARAWRGAALLSSRGLGSARVIDPTGVELQRWQARDPDARWNHVEPAPGGDLLVIDRARAIERLTRDSRVRWRLEIAAHHDIALDAAGRIHTLVAETLPMEWRGRSLPILAESVAVISPEGEWLRRVALHPLLSERLTEARLAAIAEEDGGIRALWRRLRGAAARPGSASDVYHANSIEILARDVAGIGQRGDALISFRELDLVAVVDLEVPALTWSFGPGVLDGQHHASILPGGNVLVFDNGRRRGWSRVVEVDAAGRLVWQWSGDPPGSLHSRLQGAVERLPNGHVLVTESERGRAFEVTRQGEVVFEYRSPEQDPARGARRAIYRMAHLAPGP